MENNRMGQHRMERNGVKRPRTESERKGRERKRNERNKTEWNGTKQNGTEQHGTEQNRTKRNGAEQNRNTSFVPTFSPTVSDRLSAFLAVPSVPDCHSPCCVRYTAELVWRFYERFQHGRNPRNPTLTA